MKMLLPLFILLAGPLVAQTTIIAHKSHSGMASTFVYEPNGNFGNPPPRVTEITKVNDTTTVMHMNDMGYEYDDTIYNHPIFSDPNMSVDTMRQMYYNRVEFKGFQKKPVAPVLEETLPVKRQAEPAKTEQTKPASPKKQKNNLFWLWIIGGGTFTGMLLFSRRRKAQLTYGS